MTLALYTFGVFRKPAEDPANAGFHALDGPIFTRVRSAPGFLGHAIYEGEGGDGDWDAGPQHLPRFYVEKGDGWSPATLSLWASVEALRDFSEGGLHAVALARARQWFDEAPWPGHAAWWVAPGEKPSWAEAVERFEHLADHGPSARAFSIHEPWPAEAAG